jgi:hypothetical protein
VEVLCCYVDLPYAGELVIAARRTKLSRVSDKVVAREAAAHSNMLNRADTINMAGN